MRVALSSQLSAFSFDLGRKKTCLPGSYVGARTPWSVSYPENFCRKRSFQYFFSMVMFTGRINGEC